MSGWPVDRRSLSDRPASELDGARPEVLAPPAGGARDDEVEVEVADLGERPEETVEVLSGLPGPGEEEVAPAIRPCVRRCRRGGEGAAADPLGRDDDAITGERKLGADLLRHRKRVALHVTSLRIERLRHQGPIPPEEKMSLRVRRRRLGLEERV